VKTVEAPLSPDKQSPLGAYRKWGWLFFLLIIAAIVFVYYQEFYKHKQAEIRDLHDKRMDLEERLMESQEIFANLGKFKKRVEYLRMRILEMKKWLPNDMRLASVIESIRSTAQTSGVTFTRFVPGKTKKREGYSEVSIELEMNGTVDGLHAFFSRVIKMERLIAFPKMTFTQPEKKEGKWMITISATAKTFALAPTGNVVD